METRSKNLLTIKIVENYNVYGPGCPGLKKQPLVSNQPVIQEPRFCRRIISGSWRIINGVFEPARGTGAGLYLFRTPIHHFNIIFMKQFIAGTLIISVVLYSCSGKPSEKEIGKKILMEYICPEKASIENLKVINVEETTTFIGGKAWRYTVTGAVVWPEGCREFGSGLQPGAREQFQKTVTLGKGDDGKWY